MPSKLFQPPRVDTQTVIDESLNLPAGPASLLATKLSTMKALSESHRVLENLIIRTWNRSHDLPISTDEKFSIAFLILFAVYVFVVYPFLICPTADIPVHTSRPRRSVSGYITTTKVVIAGISGRLSSTKLTVRWFVLRLLLCP